MTPFVSPITKSPCLQAQRDHGRLKPPDLTDRIHRHVSLWLWGKFWKIESTKSKLSLWTIQYNSMFRMTLQWLYQNSGARTDQNCHETLQRQTIGHPKISDYDVRHAMKRYHIMIIMWCSVAMPGFFFALCFFANLWCFFCNYTASDFAGEHGHRPHRSMASVASVGKELMIGQVM